MRLTMLSAACLVAATPAAAQTDMSCPYRERPPLAGRPSPLDSVSFQLGGNGMVKVCYGRPSSRGRTMIGGAAAPYGRIWRTGANETTKIRSTVPLSIAGINVPAGTHALYTVPGEKEWEVVINRAWEQWGQEGTYSDSIKAMEVGRATVPVEALTEPIEQFTIRADRTGEHSVNLVLEWERTRVKIPIRDR